MTDLRRAALAVALGLAALISPGTASAMPLTLEHEAPVPCSVACAYWEGGDAAGFDVCTKRFPPGSYDYTTLRMTADGIAHVQATSVIDWDTFVCTTDGQRLMVACGRLEKCTLPGDGCSGVAGQRAVAVGCTEQKFITLNDIHAANGGANDEFILLSYNWSDYAPLSITVSGPAEIVDDSYDATGL